LLLDTAFVKSSKGAGEKNWMYCDDSKITQHTVNDVVVSGRSEHNQLLRH
jgi:hypothetical protein